ncbi:MAG: hypothetical protein Q4B67_00190 [Eubacteriales bacterium]|nr:hypothetical protein [Eubacteriales bacterium]
MKKFIAAIIAIMMVLSLVACGGKSAESNETKKAETKTEAKAADAPLAREEKTEEALKREDGASDKVETKKEETKAEKTETIDLDFNFEDVTSNEATDIIWAFEDEETKRIFVEEAKAEGVEVIFGADGTTTMIEPTGEKYVQTPDGVWTIDAPDGGTIQMGGNWPDNEFTKGVPEPSFGITAVEETSIGFTAILETDNLDDLKKYCEKIKVAGFTEELDEQEVQVQGMDIYSFTAKNSAGKSVNIAFTAGVAGITISNF